MLSLNMFADVFGLFSFFLDCSPHRITERLITRIGFSYQLNELENQLEFWS